MTNYQVLNVGAPDAWRSHVGGFDVFPLREERRVVDHEMDMQYIGMTVNSLVAGEECGYWHKHSGGTELPENPTDAAGHFDRPMPWS